MTALVDKLAASDSHTGYTGGCTGLDLSGLDRGLQVEPPIS
jgi:hypothetical protein